MNQTLSGKPGAVQSACLAPLRAGGRLSARRGRPRCGCIPIIDIREDHSMKLFTEEQRTKLLANGDPKGGRPQARGQSGLTHAARAPGCCRNSIPNSPDECGFGLADLGFGTPESGSIGLLELTEYRGPFGLGIERDIHFTAAFSPIHLRRSRARRGAYRRIGTRTRSRCRHPRRHAGDETHRP